MSMERGHFKNIFLGRTKTAADAPQITTVFVLYL